MKSLLFILYNLVCIKSHGIYMLKDTQHNKQFIDEPFIKMNHQCLLYSDKTFMCSSVPRILDFDPDKSKDIITVCTETKAGKFTNDQLASLVNTRLKELGLDKCNISVIEKFSGHQFKEQCPSVINNYCNKNI